MPLGDYEQMPTGSFVYFQHLMKKLREHCGSIKNTIRFVGIAESSYKKLMDDDHVVKSTAQKILNAYAKVAPYNKEKNKNAKAA